MNNQEIKTITEAMAAKQTWIRKSLDDFLEIWAEITADFISGHKEMVLFEFSEDEEKRYKLHLKRGSCNVHGATKNPYSGEWEEWEDYWGIDCNSPISKVKRTIQAIVENLPKYFKDIQADIDGLSESGMKINALIDKLK